MKLWRHSYSLYSYLIHLQHAFSLNNSSVPALQKSYIMEVTLSMNPCTDVSEWQLSEVANLSGNSAQLVTIKAMTWTGCNLKTSPLWLATAVTSLLNFWNEPLIYLKLQKGNAISQPLSLAVDDTRSLECSETLQLGGKQLVRTAGSAL